MRERGQGFHQGDDFLLQVFCECNPGLERGGDGRNGLMSPISQELAKQFRLRRFVPCQEYQ